MKKELHLILKKQWYKMIESGIKTEEYRDLTDYWKKRLVLQGFIKCSIVTFHYGYTKKTMSFKINYIEINNGKEEWGAPKDENVFIIKLGERIK